MLREDSVVGAEVVSLRLIMGVISKFSISFQNK